jgi:hypothetical protein
MRAVISDIVVGIVPVSQLAPSTSICSTLWLLMVDGMVPAIEFFLSCRLVSAVRLPMLSGIEPDSRFCDRSSSLRLDNAAIVDGIEPLIACPTILSLLPRQQHHQSHNKCDTFKLTITSTNDYARLTSACSGC